MISELFTVYLTKYILLHTYMYNRILWHSARIYVVYLWHMCHMCVPLCAWKIKNNILLHKKKNRFFDFTLYMCVDM